MKEQDIFNWWKSKLLSHQAMFDLEKSIKNGMELNESPTAIIMPKAEHGAENEMELEEEDREENEKG